MSLTREQVEDRLTRLNDSCKFAGAPCSAYVTELADTYAALRQQLTEVTQERDKAKLLVLQLSREERSPVQDHLLFSNLTTQLTTAQERDGYQEAHKDTQRLVRKLDVIWNGEAGAAKQASLCDMVAQIAQELPEIRQQLDSAEMCSVAHLKMYVEASQQLATVTEEYDTSIAALSVHLGLEIERLKQQLATVAQERDKAIRSCAVAAKGIVNLDEQLAQAQARINELEGKP